MNPHRLAGVLCFEVPGEPFNVAQFYLLCNSKIIVSY